MLFSEVKKKKKHSSDDLLNTFSISLSVSLSFLKISPKKSIFNSLKKKVTVFCFSTLCRDGEQIEDEEDEKYSFSDDSSELTIRNVDKNDEAEYVCIAENKAGEQDASIHLKVFGNDSGGPNHCCPPPPLQFFFSILLNQHKCATWPQNLSQV